MSNPLNMTNQMDESLCNLRSSLLCPLCNQLMVDCSMLHCGHSFCHGCILDYTADNWNCPVVGCNMPVSAGRARGTSYVKKNSQIASVISALLALEQNIANAPERWWMKSATDEEKIAVVQFDGDNEGGDDEVIDFQQLNEEDDNAGAKLKSSDNQDDNSSIAAENFNDSTKEEDLNLSNTLLFKTSDRACRERVSCSVPALFSQQYSPISMKNSQQSEVLIGTDSSKKRKIATFSQIDTIYQSLGQRREENDEQKTATEPEIQAPLRPLDAHSITLKEQAIISGTKSRRLSRVSFQPRPKVMLLYPSLTLKAADARCVRKCISDGYISMLSKYPTDNLDFSFDFETEAGRNCFIKMLSCHREDNAPPVPLSCYAISTDKDYSMDDGIVVPRTFRYYLAVAMGIPIVDVGFLSKFSSKKKGSTGRQQYPFPFSPGKNLSGEIDNKFRVIGASDYAWNSPQKAVAAALERHQSWLYNKGNSTIYDSLRPGTDLLNGYNVVLLGEYDQPSDNQKTVKRKKQKHGDTAMKKTRGSLIVLLTLCGARVYDVKNVTTVKQLKFGLHSCQCNAVDGTLPSQNDFPALKDVIEECNIRTNLIVMVKDEGNKKFAEEFLLQYFTASTLPFHVLDQIPIVTSSWLLDSIGEFEVKKIT